VKQFSVFLILLDFVGGLNDETQSAESATGNRNRSKIDASPERAKEVSPALSGLGSNPILSLLSVALSALRGSSFKSSTRSVRISSFQISVFRFQFLVFGWSGCQRTEN
jgi:hypothetical protein